MNMRAELEKALYEQDAKISRRGFLTLGLYVAAAAVAGAAFYRDKIKPKETPAPVDVSKLPDPFPRIIENRTDILWDEKTGKYTKVTVETEFFPEYKYESGFRVVDYYYYYNTDPVTGVRYKVLKHTPELRLDTLEEYDRQVIEKALDYLKKNYPEDYEYVMYWLEDVKYSNDPKLGPAASQATMWINRGWPTYEIELAKKVYRRGPGVISIASVMVHETDHEELKSTNRSAWSDDEIREVRAMLHGLKRIK